MSSLNESGGQGDEQMVRLTALLRRNPKLSPEEFDAHWRDVHGPLMKSLPGIEHRVVRYEQHPRAVAARAWTGSEGVDGMAVQWFRRPDDLMAMISDDSYQEKIAPDERHLLDLDRSLFIVTSEPRVVIDGPGR
jgi:uncharacterized protein (TIGR02118 family)